MAPIEAGNAPTSNFLGAVSDDFTSCYSFILSWAHCHHSLHSSILSQNIEGVFPWCHRPTTVQCGSDCGAPPDFPASVVDLIPHASLAFHPSSSFVSSLTIASTMWRSLAVVPLLLAPSLAQILAFGAGQLPLCAQTCTELANAQAPCIGSPSTEQTCFCSSPILGNLATSSDAICNTVCPAASDRQQIQGWFNNKCQNAQANPNNQPTSPNAPASSPTDASAAATSSSFTGTPVKNDQSW